MQFFLEKDFYIFLDFFCVLFGADNADYKIIGVTVVLDFLEAFLKRIVIVLIIPPLRAHSALARTGSYQNRSRR